MARKMFDNLNAIATNTQADAIKMIDVAELHESEDNFFELCRIEELADTILGQGGVKDNLIVRPLESGGYEIISGHRRRAAIQLLIDRGEDISHYLPCLVQEYADEESKMLDLILMNVSARQLTDAELWKSYEKIDAILKEKKSCGEKFGRVREKIAEMLNISPAQVGKMQNVDRYAIPAVKEAVENGDISISTANEIAKLDEEQQEQLAESDLSSIQHKEVKEIVERTKTVPWDGGFAADFIMEHLIKWVGEECLSEAKNMNNSAYAEYLKKNKNHAGCNNTIISIMGSSDSVVMKFIKPTGNEEIDTSDISSVSLTWSMLARQIRAYSAEERSNEVNKKSTAAVTAVESSTENESDEIEKVDTYINSDETASEDETEEYAPENASVAPLSVEDFIRKNFRVMTEMCLDYIEYGCNDEDDVEIVKEFKELISCFEE